METALLSTNHAIGLALVATDIASYQLETPSEVPTTTTDSGDTGLSDTGSRRHGENGPCPELFAVSDRLIEVDYRTGCLPRSGLMPVVVAGAVFVERSGSAFDGNFDTYAISLTHTLDGTMTGDISGTEGDLSISTTFDLRATDGEESLTATGSASAHFTDRSVTLDGAVRIDDGETIRSVLDNVVLDLADIPGECPEPRKGTATAKLQKDAIVDYAEPGEGQVTVRYGQRTSDDVRLCAFGSWLF